MPPHHLSIATLERSRCHLEHPLQHLSFWLCTGSASDTLTPIRRPGWHKILADISHVDCCRPYLQDQDHIFLLIPGRTSFKRPRIGTSSPLFPCFPHIFSCGELFTAVMQEEKKGWGESGVLSAGHSVAPAALHRPPWPLHPTRRDAAPSRGCMSEQKEKEMSHFPGQRGQPSGTGEGWVPRRNSGVHPRLCGEDTQRWLSSPAPVLGCQLQASDSHYARTAQCPCPP